MDSANHGKAFCPTTSRRIDNININNHKRSNSMNFFDKHERKIERVPFSGCWIWTAANNGKYGTYGANGRVNKAHRGAYESRFGKIQNGLHICHHCDVTFCVNPDHLFAGTKSENQLDMVRKGRDNKTARARGPDHGLSKLTNGDVVYIRSHAGKISQRVMAKMFGVTHPNIGAIIRRETWKHLP